MYECEQPLDLSLSGRRNDVVTTHSTSKHSEASAELKIPNIGEKLSRRKPQISRRHPMTTTSQAKRPSSIVPTRPTPIMNKMPPLTPTTAQESNQNGTSDTKSSAPNLFFTRNGNEFSLPLGLSLDQTTLSNIRRRHDLNAGVSRTFGYPSLFFNDKYLGDCEKAFKAANPYAYDTKLPFLQDLIWQYTRERLKREHSPAISGLIAGSDISPRATDVTSATAAGQTFTTEAPREDDDDARMVTKQETFEGQNSDQGHDLSQTNHLNDIFNNVITKAIYGQATPPPASASPRGDDVMNDGAPTQPVFPRDDDVTNDDTPTQPVFPQPCDNFYLSHKTAEQASPAPPSLSPPPLVTSSFVADLKPEAKKPKLTVNTSRKIKPQAAAASDNSAQKITDINTTEDATKGGGVGGNKKSRPKRGQYRKYNHELLLEAVKAVQRGEMSVHRAGSFYGVPHSTLEYKVKERHLLRAKKPREPRTKKTDTAASNDSCAPADAPANGTSSSAANDMTPAMSLPSQASMFTPVKAEQNKDNATLMLSKPKMAADINANAPAVAPPSLEALHNSLLFNGTATPTFPPFPPPFPLGLGLAGMFNGGAPPALPDPGLLSLYAGLQSQVQGYQTGQGSFSQTSASELLKNLQAKVQSMHSRAEALDHNAQNETGNSPTGSGQTGNGHTGNYPTGNDYNENTKAYAGNNNELDTPAPEN